MTEICAAVTCNYLTRKSSIRESLFVLNQENYRKFQKTFKRKQNKIIFLFSNLQITIHFLLSLLKWYVNEMLVSSGKWSDPGHFLKSQGKFFLSFPCTLFYIFLTPKITDEILKSTLGRSILHYYHFCNI